MAQSNDIFGMLDLMPHPGFCVENQKIVKVNPSAARYMIAPGDEITPLLHTGQDEYTHFAGGCLYLTLRLGEQLLGTSVTRMGNWDVFLLDEDADQAELQAMALAATQLRDPLTSVMTVADALFPAAARQADPAIQDKVSRLNRGLYQMLRVIFNMSDAARYSSATALSEAWNICAILEDIFHSTAELAAQAGITLSFTNLPQPIFGLADKEKLERAVLNILSNAMKFTPAGGTIDARLTKRGHLLFLTVQDSGDGVPDNLKGNVFNRFRRTPGIEDGRFGIGLGMVLIRSAAALHGGTVLMEQPEGSGNRITMTIAIRESRSTMVRSPIFRVDYAGERDHKLIELSESLPPSLYETHNMD